MPAQIHRIYSSLPISCCIASSFLQTNRNQPMSFVPSWVPYAEQPAYTLQIVGTRSEQSARILSLCGNACTVNFMDLLPLLASTCTRCSEPCGRAAITPPSSPSMVDSCSVCQGRLPLPVPFWASLGTCTLFALSQQHVLSLCCAVRANPT